MNSSALMLFLHLCGVVVWVGGMFFAYVCLRPVAAARLDPPLRLTLWAGVFARFFPWVWAAVSAILSSGLVMLLAVGWRGAPIHWQVMAVFGGVMITIFVVVFFAPYRRLCRGVATDDWKMAGAALNLIRQMVGINLLLGIATISIATLGRALI